ncbi:MAG: isochorismatase family protein, partial [Gammaproteobacteria bacterium]|nr:isochorismatase family protein [Gammaproteobacteria bacterium]
MADADSTLICHAAHSQLVVVDTQERLAAAMPDADRAHLIRNMGILLEACGRLAVPVTITEQYPKGLGPTLPDIAEHLPGDARRLEKTSFSCCEAPGFNEGLELSERPQVVLTGMEAHICVLRTALELEALGAQVFVVADGVISRDPVNHDNG